MELGKKGSEFLKKVIIVFSIWFIYQAVSGLWAILGVRNKKVSLEKEINILKAKIAILEKEKNFLLSDEGIETLARVKLRMKKDNEKLIFVVKK